MHSQNKRGTIAQLVEQRTENPCVPGSIPGGTTYKTKTQLMINQLRFSILHLPAKKRGRFLRTLLHYKQHDTQINNLGFVQQLHY